MALGNYRKMLLHTVEQIMSPHKVSALVIKAALWLFILFAIATFIEYRIFAHDDWRLNDGQAEMSDAEEIEMGKQADPYIKSNFYFETEQEINTRVNAIVQRLVAVCDRKTLPFTCNIIDSYSINAFSAPGGHIYLTSGLLRFVETEDEVAGIIGHEVAHASLRHASKLYCEVMKNYGHKTENNAAAGLLLLNNHLEEFEVDADTVGVLYAQKAGFDPDGLPNFLERHLDAILQSKMFGVPGFGIITTINFRVNRLREYIATLGEKK